MNLDTEYVMYEVLTRNYKTLVPVDEEHINRLADQIVDSVIAEGGDEQFVQTLTYDDRWTKFANLIPTYLEVLVEVSDEGISLSWGYILWTTAVCNVQLKQEIFVHFPSRRFSTVFSRATAHSSERLIPSLGWGYTRHPLYIPKQNFLCT